MNAVVLLAAGASRRFGGDKLLFGVHDHPLVWHTGKRLLGAQALDLGVAVVRPGAADIAAVLTGIGYRCVECAGVDAGISASLGAGIGALSEGTTLALVALGDQPVPTTVVDLLFDAAAKESKQAIMPLYRGRRGNPVVFRESMFPALTRLKGDVGARRLLADMGADVAEIETGVDVPPDLDSDADVVKLEAYLA